MKKSALLAAVLLMGVGLSGCPVYDSHDSSDAGCFDDFDCPSGSWCDGGTGTCVGTNGTCDEPNDCASNETCSRSGTCTPGDCHFESVGCVSGFECSGESGRWECVEEGSSSSNGGAAGVSSGGAPAAGAGAPASAGESGASSGGVGGSD